MTNTEAKVRRYEGYLRTRGGWEDEQRQWYVPAADHDAAIASLRDQLQASQVAEQMASDDVRAYAARIRLAVEALKNIQAGYDGYGFTGVNEALAAIGEVPQR